MKLRALRSLSHYTYSARIAVLDMSTRRFFFFHVLGVTMNLNMDGRRTRKFLAFFSNGPLQEQSVT